MELLVMVLAVVQLLAIGATVGGFIRISRRLNGDERRAALVTERTQDSFYDVSADVTALQKSVKGTDSVRDSMDEEIRNRQASIDAVARLVGRQSRAISEHIESNLHRG